MSRGCFVLSVTLGLIAAGCTPTPATADVDLASGVGGNGVPADLTAPAEPRDLAGIGAADLAVGGDLAAADLATAAGAHDLAAPAVADLAPPPVAHDLAAATSVDLATATSVDLAMATSVDLAAATGVDLAAADLAATGVDLAAATGVHDLAIVADFAAADDLARCPYAPAGAASTLYLLAPSGSGLFAARVAAGGWSALPAAAGAVAVDDVALATVAGRPFAVLCQHDATLASVRFDDCSGFVAPAPIGALSSALPPALVGGATTDVVFRGNIDGDARLYWLHDDGSGFGSAAVEGNFLSTLAPTAFRAGSDVHTVFTGTDGNLYDGIVQANGGAATALTGNTSARGPAVAVDQGGSVHVLYSGDDNHVYSFVTSQPTVVHSLCDGQPASCYVVTDAAPLLAIGSDDTPVAVYHGSDGALYSAQLVGDAWTTVVAVSAGETTSLPAALVTGSGGSIVDVVYVRDGDGLPRHATLGSAGWTPPVTIAATPLTGAPALTVAP